MSQTTVGLLILVAALVTALAGVGLRIVVGRKSESPAVRRTVITMRDNKIGQLLFGRVLTDPFDDDELDGMILMPAIVLACGLFLTGVFLLGYDVLT
ncbi:hypothetical protein SBI67_06635 [Mycolicibacterium sp. 120266]|uniref:hypothetical protein n=1 Tax=Mycolicibacterium sp. 120266 TaxID=3090601 RepID=UPI00299D2099|nr:hypothetical protein [Mycolicibacterium sp. 120266]MDX1871788.1 hypothetical protein [Mycolicibacterium sp. 120266]